MATDGTTFINPLGLGFTLLMGFLLILLPRRFALVPVIILTCYMTMGQRVLIVGLDFTMLRILTLFGWVRLVLRGEVHSIRLNAIDKAILLWTLSSIVTYTLLWQTSDAFINRLGLAYNAVGMYFLFRFLVKDLDEALRVFKILAIFIAPLAISMLVEKTTGRNAFGIFGGVPEITLTRDGALRCQGPFGHPILAGVFGAAALPLFVALWWQGRGSRLAGFLGIASSTIIVVTAASTTPVMTYLAALLGLSMWPLRKHMRAVRWGLLATVIALHVVMKAPVWALIGRIKVLGSSAGYHRYYLINQAIENLGDWWLIGTKSTAEWGRNLFDVTNQYLRVGADGGLLTMILFIGIIVCSFAAVGRAIRSVASETNGRQLQLGLWAIGTALFAHTIAFFAVSYWDQNIVAWYLLLAIIATGSALTNLTKRQPLRSELRIEEGSQVSSEFSLPGLKPARSE